MILIDAQEVNFSLMSSDCRGRTYGFAENGTHGLSLDQRECRERSRRQEEPFLWPLRLKKLTQKYGP